MILLCNDFVCTQIDHGEMTDQNAHNLNVFEHHFAAIYNIFITRKLPGVECP